MTTAARAYRTANRRKSNARSIRPAANSTDSCKKVRHHHRSGEYYASVADALAPRRVSRGPWNKCGRGIAAFMPRKPLDALEGARRSGQLPGMFFHPRRLPHGECGVWGSAPGVTATAPPDARNMSKYPRIPLTNQLIDCPTVLIQFVEAVAYTKKIFRQVSISFKRYSLLYVIGRKNNNDS